MDDVDLEQALAEWNRGLEPIEPLIEYYARQMGQMNGRLAAALSFLSDLEQSGAWMGYPEEVKRTTTYSRLLVASAMKMVSTAQRMGNG